MHWGTGGSSAPLSLCLACREAEPRATSPRTWHIAPARQHPLADEAATAHPHRAAWAWPGQAPPQVILGTPSHLPPPESAGPQGSPCFLPCPCYPPTAAVPRTQLGWPTHGACPCICFYLHRPDPAPSSWPQCLVHQCCRHLCGMGHPPAQAPARPSLPTLGCSGITASLHWTLP